MKVFMLLSSLLLCMITGSLPLSAYPSQPYTLRQLIEASDYIVFAEVDNPDFLGPAHRVYSHSEKDTIVIHRFYLHSSDTARLNVLEVLKGNPASSNLNVRFEVGSTCPAPAHYRHKEKVITFLIRRDTSAYCEPVGMSYGTIEIEEGAYLNLLRSHIREYVTILSIADSASRRKAKVEWLVKGVEHADTRHDAAYDFWRFGTWIAEHDFSDDERLRDDLTVSQRKRIEKVIYACDTLSFDDVLLSHLIPTKHLPRLRKNILLNLGFEEKAPTTSADTEYSMDEFPASFPDTKLSLMTLFLEYWPTPELEKIQSDAARVFDPTEEEMQRWVREFIAVAEKEGG